MSAYDKLRWIKPGKHWALMDGRNNVIARVSPRGKRRWLLVMCYPYEERCIYRSDTAAKAVAVVTYRMGGV